MKIPLEHEPFAPVVLTGDQERQLQWLSDALLDETLAENDDFVHRQNRVLDKTKWKQVMARENIVIYKRVGKGELGGFTPEVDLTTPHQEPHSRHWRLPMCVGVGTLAGTLDDLLYGAYCPTSTEFKVRSTYIKDGAADTRVVATIVKPTASDPLRSMAVRWTLLRQFIHNLGVAPRDVLHLDSTGTRILPNGERVGYIIHQSVDLPGCERLTRIGLVRAAYSASFLFRDTGRGSIEMYMRAYMVPGGKMGDSVAVFSASLSLIAIWRMMLAGQNKKLVYMARTIAAGEDLFTIAKRENSKTCPLCLKSLSSFRSSSKCDLCHVKMCSRCVDKRKLTHVRSNGELLRVPTTICKPCITKAARMNAGDVAANELNPDERRTIRFYSFETSSSQDSEPRSRRSPSLRAWFSRNSSASFRQSVDTISSDRTEPAFASSIESTNFNYGSSIASSESMSATDVTLPSPSVGRLSWGGVDAMNQENEASAGIDQSRLELWARLNKLRIATEETHALTQQNAATWLADKDSAVTRPGPQPIDLDSIGTGEVHKGE